MSHPLGEAVLFVPERDAALPDQQAEFEAELAGRGVDFRRVPLGRDPLATAQREVDRGTRFLVHCGGQASMVRWLPVAVGTELVVGAFPGGVPNDFARTFGLDTNPAAAAQLLASDRVLRVDVGVATVGGREHHVFNHAVIGIGAGRRGRGLGALAGWYAELLTARRARYDVDMTFAEYHAPATQVRVANAQWAVQGLFAAPLALPDDGAWDVQVWHGPRSLPFTLQPRMLRGEHLPNAHISTWRHKRVTVAATPPAKVALDDVIVGRTPVELTLLPKALRLKI